MRHALAPLLVASLGMAQQPAAPRWTPAQSVRWAAADAATLPAERQRVARYIDLGALGVKERADWRAVLAGHLASLSRNTDPLTVEAVPGSGGAVLRVYLDEGGWPDGLWEKLESPYHVQGATGERWERRTWPAGKPWSDGKVYAQSFTYQEKVQGGADPAEWLSPDAEAAKVTAALVNATQSKVPLVSGEWLLWQTAVQEQRGQAGYYDFLGVKSQKDFEKLVRFDAKLSSRLEQRRVVVWSGVTQEPRRVEVTRSALGPLWRTFDNVEAVGKKNPANFLFDDYDFEFTEQIGTNPGGFPVFLLANKAGQAQGKAPDDVVGRERRSHKDLRLQVNLDCLFCHFRGKDDGIIPLDAEPVGKFSSTDYAKVRQFNRLYKRDQSPWERESRFAWGAAIRGTTGLPAAEWARAVVRAFTEYDERRYDLHRAARDLGLEVGALRAALVRYAEAQGGLLEQSQLTILANGRALPVRQYHESLSHVWKAAVQGGAKQ